MVTCKEEMVKFKSNSGSLPPEKHVEEGEYQVQHSPEHHGDHLHAEKGRDKVQHNIQNTMEITCMYRVSFLTGPAQKISKYGTGPT